MYVIIHGDIGDIDYVSVTGPFATQDEANAEGDRLETEGKLPNEDNDDTAWRVQKVEPVESLSADYEVEEEEDY